MSHKRRSVTVTMVLLVCMAALLSSGCFAKGGGGAAATSPGVSDISAGSIVSKSVATVKNADGTVMVSWKTASPSMGNHVLAGTLFFEGRPLYGEVIKETATAPTTDHVATLPAVSAKTAVAVTDGLKGLDDNAGFGYVVE